MHEASSKLLKIHLIVTLAYDALIKVQVAQVDGFMVAPIRISF